MTDPNERQLAEDRPAADDIEARRALRQLDRERLTSLQLDRLRRLLAVVLPANRFHSERLAGLPAPRSLDELASWPLMTKQDLIGDSGEFASNLTWPIESYVRFHRTSGTRGRPLVVLDTTEDWDWWCDGWQHVLDVVAPKRGCRALLAFSFGPFIGFWSAFDAATRRGMLVAPAGGMSTAARVELIRSFRAEVLFCTPTYAEHLADQAERDGIDPASTDVRAIIVAGEPGGSLPEVRTRIERRWNARVVDHAGASEVGPWGIPDPEGRGLLVNEAEFIAEFLLPGSESQAEPNEAAELVLTSLGRSGSPVIRYRTGDLVRPRRDSAHRDGFVLLEGGVLGRVDDMLIVRGVNVFPSSIETIIRSFPEVGEYRLIAFRKGAMDAVRIELEQDRDVIEPVARAIELRLGLKAEVASVPSGSLPRSDGKSKRFVDRRRSGEGETV